MASEAIELTTCAKVAGANYGLSVTPYYNKPTQHGMIEHVRRLAEVGLPIVLYNIPGRCGVELTVETIVKMYEEIELVAAVKEATGKLNVSSEIAASCDITILSGDDSLTLPIASVGGKGVISVVANIVPTDVKAMTDLILEGDFVSARRWHNKLFALSKSLLSMATNPIPIKAAMAMLGMSPAEMRLPMVQLEESKRSALQQILREYGLLKS